MQVESRSFLFCYGNGDQASSFPSQTSMPHTPKFCQQAIFLLPTTKIHLMCYNVLSIAFKAPISHTFEYLSQLLFYSSLSKNLNPKPQNLVIALHSHVHMYHQWLSTLFYQLLIYNLNQMVKMVGDGCSLLQHFHNSTHNILGL